MQASRHLTFVPLGAMDAASGDTAAWDRAAATERIRRFLAHGALPPGRTPVFWDLGREGADTVRGRGLEAVFEFDLEERALDESLNGLARDWASRWYRACEDAGLSPSPGVNVGRLVEWDATYLFIGLLRKARCLLHVFRDLAPESVDILDPATGQREVVFPRPGVPFDSLFGQILLRLCEGYLLLRRQRLCERDPRPAPLLWLTRLRRRIQNRVLARAARGKRAVLFSSDLKHVRRVLEGTRGRGYGLAYLRERESASWVPEFWRLGAAFYVSGDFRDARRARELYAAVSQATPQALDRVHASKLFVFEGLDLWAAVEPFLAFYLTEQSRELCELLVELDALLGRVRPEGIYVDEDVGQFNKTLALLAERRGIPSVVIQHGAPFEKVPVALSPVSATKIAAWGPYSEQCLRAWGVPGSKIARTGAPRCDEITAHEPGQRGRLKGELARSLALDASKAWIVVGLDKPHPSYKPDFVGIELLHENAKRIVERVVEAASGPPAKEIVVKLHPRSHPREMEFAKSLASEHRVSVVQHVPSFDLLRACDVLVVESSSLAIEAMICDKPVITMNLTVYPDLQPHAEKGAALAARTGGELRRAFEVVFGGGPELEALLARARRVLPEYLEALDGTATRRVLDLMEALIDTPASAGLQDRVARRARPAVAR